MKATHTKNNYQNILKLKRFDEKMPDPSFVNHIFKRIKAIAEKDLETLKLTVI